MKWLTANLVQKLLGAVFVVVVVAIVAVLPPGTADKLCESLLNNGLLTIPPN